MPRTTRNRTLIAQARLSEAELAEWRAKAAAAGVGLSELLRRAMARTRTWTAAAAKVERGAHPGAGTDRLEPEPDRPLGEHPQGERRGGGGDRAIWSRSSGHSTLWRSGMNRDDDQVSRSRHRISGEGGGLSHPREIPRAGPGARPGARKEPGRSESFARQSGPSGRRGRLAGVRAHVHHVSELGRLPLSGAFVASFPGNEGAHVDANSLCELLVVPLEAAPAPT